jgi:hypothetical protein
MPEVYPIAWENRDFVQDDPYLTVEMVRLPPIDRTLNGEAPIKRGFMQVNIVGLLDKWARPNEIQADLIALRFRKSQKLDVTGGKVTITKQPFIGQGYRDGSRWRLPVQIHYEAS